jgi:hypothetical protein
MNRQKPASEIGLYYVSDQKKEEGMYQSSIISEKSWLRDYRNV